MLSLNRLAIIAASFLALGLDAHAQDAELQRRINEAIDKGVRFLRSTPRDSKGKVAYTGNEAGLHPGQHVGMTALIAWTCLESGVAGDSSDLAGLADAVRDGCLDLRDTYSLSVTIMFLDRLGDPGDEPLIEAMALRLLGGRSPFSTWGYQCLEPGKEEVNTVKKQIEEARVLRGKGEIGPARTRPMANRKPSPELIKRVKQIAPNYQQKGGDNSNTQFAMLALWVARRHGVPVDDTLMQVAQHFRGMQARPNPGASPLTTPVEGNYAGMWGYQGEGPPSVTMTCAGLLGIALGHGVARKKDKGLAELSKDQNVKIGLHALDGLVKHAKTARDVYLMPDRDVRCVYYFLFSLERMALVYNLKQIGGKDWYTWGASYLVDAQGSAGNWIGKYGYADTCFALLFLKRANVAQDLTFNLLGLNPIEKPKAKSPKKKPEPDPFDELPKLIEKKKAPPKKSDDQSWLDFPPRTEWPQAVQRPNQVEWRPATAVASTGTSCHALVSRSQAADLQPRRRICSIG